MDLFCWVCGALIGDGVPHWSLSATCEIKHEWRIDVLHGDTCMTFCFGCGLLREFRAASVPLREPVDTAAESTTASP